MSGERNGTHKTTELPQRRVTSERQKDWAPKPVDSAQADIARRTLPINKQSGDDHEKGINWKPGLINLCGKSKGEIKSC